MRTKQLGPSLVMALAAVLAAACGAPAGAVRDAPLAAASLDAVDEAGMVAADVDVIGIEGWFVTDPDGQPGGPLVLRGYTAGGTTFEHPFRVELDRADAALGDPERGFVYVFDAAGGLVLVHEIGRALDRTVALPAEFDPAVVALLDGGLGLRLCSDGPHCRIATISLRDPSNTEVRPWP